MSEERRRYFESTRSRAAVRPLHSAAPIQRLCRVCEEEDGALRGGTAPGASGEALLHQAIATPMQSNAAVDPGPRGLVATAQASALHGPDATGIPGAVRAKMEAAFGTDFSGVRVHTASARALALGALAYTQGNEIHVAPGHWAPQTTQGQELLGHELSHVVQQRKGRVKATAQMKGVSLNDDPALEAEADAIGAKAARGEAVSERTSFALDRFADSRAGGERPSLQRKEACTCGGTCAGCVEQADKEGGAPDRVVQRYAMCKPPRLSLEECPPREPGETKRARDGAMVFLPDLFVPALNDPGSGERGALIANFDIGHARIKPNLHATFYWQAFLKQIAADRSRWKLVGFSDCQGGETRNRALRGQRAKAVFDILPKGIQPRIDSIEGAPTEECITENDTAADRTLNRSVAVLLTQRPFDYRTLTVVDTLERQAPDTDDCSPAQKSHLAVAYPLAKRMIENAMSIISTMKRGSAEEALLRKFFGKDAFVERWHIKQGYVDALGAWNGNPTYKCVKQGQHPCESALDSGYTGASGLITGSPIIVCEYSFNSYVELADTILHEETHALGWTWDHEQCDTTGCSLETTDELLPGIGLSDRGALANAASYARFASQAFALGY